MGRLSSWRGGLSPATLPPASLIRSHANEFSRRLVCKIKVARSSAEPAVRYRFRSAVKACPGRTRPRALRPWSVACYPAAKTAARLSPEDGSQPIRVTPASAPTPNAQASSIRHPVYSTSCSSSPSNMTMLRLVLLPHLSLSAPSDRGSPRRAGRPSFTSAGQLDPLILPAKAILADKRATMWQARP